MTASRQATAVTRLVLVRHGEVEESAQGRCCGRFDPSLSKAGVDQMTSAARLLTGLRVAIVYASPARRAIESARALVPHLEVHTDVRLHEMDFGKLEGLPFEDAARLYPTVYRTWMERPYLVRFPGGESLSMMRTRVLNVSREVRRRHAGDTIAVVAHGGVNRIVLAKALGLRTSLVFRLAQDCGAVSIIEYHGGAPTVRLLNARIPGSPEATC